MKKFTIALIFCFAVLKGNCQQIFEVGIKPTEYALLDFDTRVGIGTTKTHYGLLLAYRPATQQAGYAIPQMWNGAGSNYGRRFANRLYNAYTLGVYCKRYIGGSSDLFLEADVFYRNWSFDKKQAEYENVEKATTSYNGTRTENIDVYCMKILFGRTFYTKAKAAKPLRLYVDVYGGLGARYQQETYQTYNGTVGSVYYNYKKDEYNHFWPTPQVGIIVGLVHGKPATAATTEATQE